MTARTLARAGIVVTAAFFLSRLLGWLRLVVISNLFGARADLDAYFAAFRIPDLIFQLVAAGAISSALIPVLSGLLASDEEARAWRVVSTVINLMMLVLLALAVVVGAGPLSAADPTTISLPLAFAAGAVLASLADTLMPEAYEQGGPSVALSTTAGFILSFVLATL